MIAIGWTRPGARVPAPCHMARVGGLVVASRVQAASARDRLSLQVSCARALPAFLPLCPATKVAWRDAAALWNERSAEIAALREDFADLLQISVRTTWVRGEDAPDEDAGGQRWLRARAMQHKAFFDGGDLLCQSVARYAPRPHFMVRRDWSCRIDALLPASDFDRRASALAADLAQLPIAGAAEVVVTGPWPVLAFAKVMVAA